MMFGRAADILDHSDFRARREEPNADLVHKGPHEENAPPRLLKKVFRRGGVGDLAYIQTPALVITVTDEGKGLDVNTVPDPTTPENLLKQSGRGIFLMRSFMDEVRVRLLEPGTEVTMVKNVSGPAANHKEASK